MAVIVCGTGWLELPIVPGFDIPTTSATGVPTHVAQGFQFAAANNPAPIQFAPQTEMWMSIYFNAATSTTQAYPFTFMNGTTNVARINTQVSTRTINLEIATGASTWVSVATVPTAFTIGVTTRLDIRLRVNGTSGEFTVYVNNLQVASFTGDTQRNGASTFDRIWFATMGAATHYSAVFCTDTEDTRGLKAVACLVNAAGFHTGQLSGVFGDVDDTYANDDDFVSVLTAGNTVTFKTASVSGAISGAVEKVIVNTRIQAMTGAPAPFTQGAIRSATTTVYGPSKPNSLIFTSHIEEFATNPATGAAWTITEANASEIGIRTATS